jgi:hypothetical protein
MARGPAGIRITTDPPLEQLSRHFRISRKREMALGVGTVAGRTLSALRKVTPVKTGRLKRGQRLIKKGELEWEISEVDFYGQILRDGVPAASMNPIVPRQKKALWWPGLPHPIARVNNHPGIKKNDYFQKAIDNSRGDREKAQAKVAIKLSEDYADI